MNSTFDSFVHKISSPFRFGFFLATKLPAAFFVGLKLKQINEQSCTILVKHSWFSKNPFKSVYFAAEAMAAERASEDIARINVRKKKNEIYKQKYGTNPESDDISTLEKRGYFRVDFGDEGFQHGETYSGEEDTRRRREEYYARRGSTAPNKFLDYQKRIANMGKQILSNTRGNG